MVSPPPGVSSADRVPPIASVRPAGDGQPEAQAAGAGVAEPLERLEHPLPLRPAGTPGPRSTTITSTVSGSTWASTRTGLPPETPHGVADQVGDDPLEQAGVGGAPAAPTPRPRGDDARRVAGDGQRQHLLEAAGAQHRVEQPALQPGQVEQVVDEPLELLGRRRRRRATSSRRSSRRRRPRRAARRRRPASWPAGCAGRGRPRAGWRCEVASARSRAAARSSRSRSRRYSSTRPVCTAKRLEHPLVAWPAAARRTAPARGRRRPGPGCRPRRAWPRGAAPAGGQHRQPAGPCVEQRDGVLAERLAEPLDDRLGGVLAGQHRPGQRAQRRRLGAGARSPRRPGATPGRRRSRRRPRRRRTPAAPRGCVGSAIVNRADRRGEEPVEHEEPDDAPRAARAAGRRPGRPATVAASKQQHRPAGAGRCRAKRVQRPGQQRPAAPARATQPATWRRRLSGESSGRRSARRRDLVVGDQVDVDRARRARRSGRPSCR